jgi:hypothetical protein
MSEHAVIVSFDYGHTDLEPLFELEDQLEQLIEDAGVGEYDGNEIAVDGSDGRLYMYGPDADALFAAIKGALASAACLKSPVALLRYGPPEDGVREVSVPIAG